MVDLPEPDGAENIIYRYLVYLNPDYPVSLLPVVAVVKVLLVNMEVPAVVHLVTVIPAVVMVPTMDLVRRILVMHLKSEESVVHTVVVTADPVDTVGMVVMVLRRMVVVMMTKVVLVVRDMYSLQTHINRPVIFPMKDSI